MRLDHLLSKERLARPFAGSASSAMSGADVPGWLLVEHWLVGQLAGKAGLVRFPCAGSGTAVAVAVLPGTLLGPEGTGNES